MLPLSPLLFVLFSFFVAESHQASFSSPAYVAAYGSGRYQNLDVWYVGQTKDVVYDLGTTGLEDYTIALWQQDVTKASASKGPVVNSVTASQSGTTFSWTVSLLDFDLNTSNVFFFWIFDGSSTNQGNTKYTNIPSAYFNISTADPPTFSASSTFTTTTTTSTTQSSSTTSIVETADSTSTSSSAESVSTHAAVADTTSSPTQTISQASTGSESSSAVAISTSSSSSSAPTTSSTSGSDSSSGLSTGAAAGIGVGVGVAGICAVICAFIIVRGRKQHRGPRQTETISDFREPQDLPQYSKAPSPASPPVVYQTDTVNSQAVNHGHPAELHARGGYAAELYAGPR